MKWFVAMVALAFMGGGAAAQEPTIVDACAKAIALYWNVPAVSVLGDTVQSFPELEPPRVRFHVQGQGKTLAEGFGNQTVEALCEFESSTPPFQLSEFDCGGCLTTPERIEELRVLLAREGF